MRSLIASLGLLSCFFAASTHASEATIMDNVKTGILPNGGFYRIYEVACQDQATASVASMQRGRRWCTTYEGELTCVSRASDAAHIACAREEVALTREEADAAPPLQ